MTEPCTFAIIMFELTPAVLFYTFLLFLEKIRKTQPSGKVVMLWEAEEGRGDGGLRDHYLIPSLVDWALWGERASLSLFNGKDGEYSLKLVVL